MRKKSLTKFMAVLAVVLLSTSAFAQNGRFSAGVEVALPSGDFGENAGTGFGASLRYEMPMGDNLGLMFTAGYLTFGSEKVDLGPFGSYEYSSSMIPLMAGGKYYFTEQQEGFYAQLQLGVTMLTTKATVDFGGVSESETSSTSAFTWAPGIGYHLANIDLSASYYAFSYSQEVDLGLGVKTTVDYSGSWIGIRAAYVFGEK